MRFEMNLQSMTKNELRATSAYLAALASDSDHVAVACDAQPEVACNTGSLETVAPDSPAVDQAGNEEGAVAAAPSSTVTPEAPARRTRRTKAEMAAAAAEAAPAAEEPAANAPPPAPDKCNLDGVREALQHYTAARGMADGIGLLQRYGAGRISELAPEQYEQFAAECAAA